MAHREYVGNGITVHWDSDRCIHSELCVLGAPSVFDHDARPWVTLDGASADEVARVIDTCPSGALSYTRTDGVLNGRRGRAADEDAAASIRSDVETAVAPPRSASEREALPVITPLRNGPLMVQGPIVVAHEDGSVDVVEHVTLCRCGHSASKPNCDGSHARVGFVAPGSG